jgi:hypothetical protein
MRCGDTENTLTVHHVFYDKDLEPWDYPIENLITFCQECHKEEFDERYDLDRLLAESVRRFGCMNADVLDLATAFRFSRCLAAPEDVIAALSWVLNNEAVQQEIVDRYFEYLKEGKKRREKEAAENASK